MGMGLIPRARARALAERFADGIPCALGECRACGRRGAVFGSYGECADCHAAALVEWEAREGCTTEAIAAALDIDDDSTRRPRLARALRDLARCVLTDEARSLAERARAMEASHEL